MRLEASEERLGRIYAALGYIVVPVPRDCDVSAGNVVHIQNPITLKRTPLRIVAKTTLEEYKQAMLIGWPERRLNGEPDCDYYRMEAD